jgi:NitT/TauT family transport system substrate-binding protein
MRTSLRDHESGRLTRPTSSAPGLRRFALAALRGLAVLLALGAGTAQAADSVVFGLDWEVFGRHAGFFAALDKGYYAQEGLDVTIDPGTGGADAVKDVASGKFDFGFGDIGSLLVDRAAGLPVEAVAVVYGRAPQALWIRKDAGVTAPQDLAGKTIGAPAGSAVRLMFPAFAETAGFDPKSVQWRTADAASLFRVLFSGQADAVIGYAPGWPTVQKQAAAAGVEVTSMLFADYGFDVLSNGLLVRESVAEERPDLVRRFVKATLRGLEYAFAHPEEAAALVVARHPELDPDTAAAEIEIVRDLALTPEVQEHGLGYMAPEKMQSTRDIVTKAYHVTADVDLEAAYSNAFLPR